MPTEVMQRYRQGAGSVLFCIDRVLMNRVRNGLVFVSAYSKDSVDESISRGDGEKEGTQSSSDQPETSPLNTALIATFHALDHACCNRCALIDLSLDDNFEKDIHDSIIMRYPEPSRIFYYRPSQVSDKDHSKSDLRYNIIRVTNGSLDFRQNINTKLLSTLRAFAPDIIILKINTLHEAVPWATKKIAHVANMCCQGRIISIIEDNMGVSDDVNSNASKGVFDHVKMLIDSYHSMLDVSRNVLQR